MLCSIKSNKQVAKDNTKIIVCFANFEKTLKKVAGNVLEQVIRKKGIPEVLVRSVMTLYKGAKTRVRVDYELPEEFEVKVGMHQGFGLPPFLHTVVGDVVNELERVCAK